MQSTSAKVVCKILTVFLLFCLTKASGGTCLSYGHSCWGGHGKRNGAGQLIEAPTQKRTNNWYVSRLISPDIENYREIATLLKSQSQDAEEMDKFRHYQYKLFPPLDFENTQRNEPANIGPDTNSAKWGPDTNDSGEDLVVLTPQVEPVPMSKYRLFQFMKKDDSKKRVANQ